MASSKRESEVRFRTDPLDNWARIWAEPFPDFDSICRFKVLKSAWFRSSSTVTNPLPRSALTLNYSHECNPWKWGLRCKSCGTRWSTLLILVFPNCPSTLNLNEASEIRGRTSDRNNFTWTMSIAIADRLYVGAKRRVKLNIKLTSCKKDELFWEGGRSRTTENCSNSLQSSKNGQWRSNQKDHCGDRLDSSNRVPHAHHQRRRSSNLLLSTIWSWRRFFIGLARIIEVRRSKRPLLMKSWRAWSWKIQTKMVKCIKVRSDTTRMDTFIYCDPFWKLQSRCDTDESRCQSSLQISWWIHSASCVFIFISIGLISNRSSRNLISTRWARQVSISVRCWLERFAIARMSKMRMAWLQFTLLRATATSPLFSNFSTWIQLENLHSCWMLMSLECFSRKVDQHLCSPQTRKFNLKSSTWKINLKNQLEKIGRDSSTLCRKKRQEDSRFLHLKSVSSWIQLDPFQLEISTWSFDFSRLSYSPKFWFYLVQRHSTWNFQLAQVERLEKRRRCLSFFLSRLMEIRSPSRSRWVFRIFKLNLDFQVENVHLKQELSIIRCREEIIFKTVYESEI